MLAFSVWGGYDIYCSSTYRTELKKDSAEVNNIQYGLLSVDRWRDNITELVSEQINQFKLNGKQEKSLREALDRIINTLISQATDMVNAKQKSFGGKIKKLAFKTFVNVDKIRERVPEFSQTIIEQIQNRKNKKNLKDFTNSKLDELAEQTHATIIEQSSYGKILEKYKVKNQEELNVFIARRTDELQNRVYRSTFNILSCMFLFLLTWILIRKQKSLYIPMFIMSVILAFIVLFIGLTIPMIEIDARIKEVNFILMNKNIIFYDQVIFFQSKSIMDVAHILLTAGNFDAVFVGILVLVFSILFPVAKLLATKFYILGNEKFRKNKVIQFFAFKSGKWSMADVMVVAIFMAYVGFKGILDSQLTGLNIHTATLTSITTNKTSLQPGFILFIAFVLFSLILSEILQRITNEKN